MKTVSQNLSPRIFFCWFLFCFVLVSFVQAETEQFNLAPIHVNSKEVIENWHNTLSNPIEASLLNQVFDGEKWITTISVQFEHDRPGFLFDVLEKVSPEQNNKKTRGNLLWQELYKKGQKKVYRFSMETESREDAIFILNNIRLIKDRRNPDFDQARSNGIYKCLIDTEIPNQPGSFKKIAGFLKEKNLNISFFLNRKTETGQTHVILEVEAPQTIQSKDLDADFYSFFWRQGGRFPLFFKVGTLIDLILDEFLLEKIDLTSGDIQINSKMIRQHLRKALLVIAEQHLSRVRKDFKTPYVMHQVEAVKIMVQEFKILAPDVIMYLSKILKTPPSQLIDCILTSTLLHDAVEDGDVSDKKLKNFFHELVYKIVSRLSKTNPKGTQEDENAYLRSLLEDEGVISGLIQLIKIADRLHNLRTLEGNSPTFQRKGFFKTYLHFVPEFLDRIDFENSERGPLNQVLNDACEQFKFELVETGKYLGFLDKDGNVIPEQERLYKKEERIIDKIRINGGKLNFAEYMQEVLYGELGFYTEEVGIGRNMSFDTWAENPYFGQCMARQVREIWEKMGKTAPFKIVEMGAGKGTLAKNILSYIKENDSDLWKCLEYVIVEISPKLIKDQKESIKQAFGALEGVPIQWIGGTAETNVSQVAGVEGIFLSNELPDAFPVHRLKIVNGYPREVYVTFKNGQFQEETGEFSSPELAAYAANLPVDLPEGAEIPVNLIMKNWIQNISKNLKRGCVLTIDYGGKPEAIARAHPAGVWNRDTNDMQKIYARTSLCDITSEVNFFDLATWGKNAGLELEGYTFQRDFLGNLGIEDILINGRYLSDPLSFDLATNFSFKVMAQTKGLPQGLDLTGFISQERRYGYLHHKDVYIRVPVPVKQSSFLLCTNSSRQIPKSVFLKGARETKDFLDRDSYGYDPFKFHTFVHNWEARVDHEDNYIIQFKREDLTNLKIWNDKGDVIFDFGDYLAIRPNKEEEMLIDYKAFEEKCSGILDLSKPQSPLIPNFVSIMKNGQLEILSDVKTPDVFFLPFTLNELKHFRCFRRAS